LGAGALVAGLFAQFSADPTRLVFWVYLIALAPALLAVALTPETVAAPGRPTLAVRRPVLPDGRSSLVPAFLRDRMHVHSVAVVGAVVGLLFLVALVTQLVAPATWLSSPIVAPAFIVGGVLGFETGLWTHSVPVFIAGTALAGIGAGLAFRYGVAVTGGVAEPSRRANLFATFFLIAYAGLTVPTLALGVLDEVVDQNVATLILATGVAAVILGAAAVRIRQEARATSMLPHMKGRLS
jgi:hypothetical protein